MKYYFTFVLISFSLLPMASYAQLDNWGVVEFSIGINSDGPNDKMFEHLSENGFNGSSETSTGSGTYAGVVDYSSSTLTTFYPENIPERYNYRLTVLKRFWLKSYIGGVADYDSFNGLKGMSDSGAIIDLHFKSIGLSAAMRYNFFEVSNTTGWFKRINLYSQFGMGLSYNRTYRGSTVLEESHRIQPHAKGNVGAVFGSNKLYLTFDFGGTLFPSTKVDAFNEGTINYLPPTRVQFSHIDLSIGVGLSL